MVVTLDSQRERRAAQNEDGLARFERVAYCCAHTAHSPRTMWRMLPANTTVWHKQDVCGGESWAGIVPTYPACQPSLRTHLRIISETIGTCYSRRTFTRRRTFYSSDAPTCRNARWVFEEIRARIIKSGRTLVWRDSPRSPRRQSHPCKVPWHHSAPIDRSRTERRIGHAFDRPRNPPSTHAVPALSAHHNYPLCQGYISTEKKHLTLAPFADPQPHRAQI